jgi:hypothetical protein
MSGVKVIGLVLLVAGLAALAYGGFSYTKEKGDVNIGPVEIEVTEKERVNIPMWAGIAAAVVGGVLLAKKD